LFFVSQALRTGAHGPEGFRELNDSQRRELSNDMFHRSTGSFELVLSPLILGFLGFLLDRAVGTTPLFTILLVIAGMAGAAARVYYGYRHAMVQLAEAEARLAQAKAAERATAEVSS
jgi:F0F1-type ATP synthase assembly protein I